MQTRDGKSPGAQACITRGLESTPVRRLAKGPRSTLLKSKKNEDG